MFKRLIVATDLSPASGKFISCLGGLRSYGAEECLLVQCLNVQETASIMLSYAITVFEENLNNQKKVLEDMGFKVETRIVSGIPRSEINKIALAEDYSIIAVGAQKHSAVSELVFGGLAYDLIHHAQKPVLLVRLEDDPYAGINAVKAVSCDVSNHILFPTDFSDNADHAFGYVMKMAESGVKKVTLMHVQDRSHIEKYLSDHLSTFNVIDSGRLTDMKDMIREKADIEVNTLLTYGSPTMEILKAVVDLNVQMVVMGSQGRGFIPTIFLGSVSHNIARLTESSVLLIPAKRG